MNLGVYERYSKTWYNIADRQLYLDKRFSDDEDEIDDLMIDQRGLSASAPTRPHWHLPSENRSSKRPQSVNSDHSSHTLTTTH
mmetsp:Transcript_25513/g.4243  ORF Transcript_25513/g.4243 Transcript_25513/m.4243 type:complete len:83 (+) Transcript_25513:1115-1363(+)